MRFPSLLLLCGAAPSAQQSAVDETKALAGQFAFVGEKCRGNEVGGWSKGTWVSRRGGDLCTHYFFFDAQGAVMFDSACCEGTCRPALPKRGPATRDLCTEAKAELSDGGVSLAAFTDVTLRESDGGVVTRVPFKVRRWPLHPGRFSAAGGKTTFDFEGGPDSRRVMSDAGLQFESDGRCTLGELSFFPCKR